MMQPERADDRHAGLVALAHRGIEVRREARSQLQVLPENAFDLWILQLRGIRTPLSGFERTTIAAIPAPRQTEMPVASVRPERRIEGTELEPAHVELAGVFRGRIETANVRAPVGQA